MKRGLYCSNCGFVFEPVRNDSGQIIEYYGPHNHSPERWDIRDHAQLVDCVKYLRSEVERLDGDR